MFLLPVGETKLSITLRRIGLFKEGANCRRYPITTNPSATEPSVACSPNLQSDPSLYPQTLSQKKVLLSARTLYKETSREEGGSQRRTRDREREREREREKESERRGMAVEPRRGLPNTLLVAIIRQRCREANTHTRRQGWEAVGGRGGVQGGGWGWGRVGEVCWLGVVGWGLLAGLGWWWGARLLVVVIRGLGWACQEKTAARKYPRPVSVANLEFDFRSISARF